MDNGKRPLIVDLIVGAAAGAAATWAMDSATTFLYERQSKKITKRENAARGGKLAVEVAAEKLGVDAAVIHWSIGIGSGAVYGLLRNRSEYVGIGSGLAYGLAVYLLVDEGASTALRLSPPPNAFPWQTHVRGLAGHLILGAILDGVFDAADLVS
jgi:uncharacterized protein DUF1440